jgi:hypothetical protein
MRNAHWITGVIRGARFSSCPNMMDLHRCERDELREGPNVIHADAAGFSRFHANSARFPKRAFTCASSRFSL